MNSYSLEKTDVNFDISNYFGTINGAVLEDETNCVETFDLNSNPIMQFSNIVSMDENFPNTCWENNNEDENGDEIELDTGAPLYFSEQFDNFDGDADSEDPFKADYSLDDLVKAAEAFESKGALVEKVIRCPDCEYVTNRKCKFMDHLIVHQKMKNNNANLNNLAQTIYRCKQCDYEAAEKSLYNEHLKIHVKEKVFNYSCKKCSFSTGEQKLLAKHMEIHAPKDKVLQCPECSFQTNEKNSLMLHLKIHFGVSPLANYPCPHCKYIGDRESHLTKHMKIHSYRQGNYQCPDCPYTSGNKGHYKSHLRIHSNTPESAKFSCSQCDYKSERRSDYTRHMQRHAKSSLKAIHCNQCDYTTDVRAHMTRHMKCIHDVSVKDLQCPNCPYNTDNKNYYSRHIRRHSCGKLRRDTGKTFLCDLCPYNTERKDNLNRHLLVHSKSMQSENDLESDIAISSMPEHQFLNMDYSDMNNIV